MNRASHPYLGAVVMVLALAGLLASMLDIAAAMFFSNAGNHAPTALEIGLFSSDYAAMASQAHTRTLALAALFISALASLIAWVAIIALGWCLLRHPAISTATGRKFRHVSWALAIYVALQTLSAVLLLVAWRSQDAVASVNVDTTGLLAIGVAIAIAGCVSMLLARAIDIHRENEGFV